MERFCTYTNGKGGGGGWKSWNVLGGIPSDSLQKNYRSISKIWLIYWFVTLLSIMLEFIIANGCDIKKGRSSISP